ncbi:MAG: twin-arginine translocase subunit TatC, partial [Cyanobacteria bacterium]|nr:twin-arginine translocase subunit TatC [Cyanobacteriota bacterium]
MEEGTSKALGEGVDLRNMVNPSDSSNTREDLADDDAQKSESSDSTVVEKDDLDDFSPEDADSEDGDDDESYQPDENESDESEDEDEASMTLVEHLAELRNRLIRSICYVAVSFLVSIFF